jgi:TrpR-related protein YerC/YecD
MDNKDLQKIFSEIIIYLSLENDKYKIFSFLRDLLSEKEIIEFSKRFEVANMLYEKISYSKIEEKTGMSSTTIARVSKYLI